VFRTDEVWCADLAHIPKARGFAFLMTVMDWKETRAVISWKLSNTTDGMFCVGALREAFEAAGKAPEINQHRTKQPIHQPGVNLYSGGERGGGEHGRQRTMAGQRVHRASLAFGQT